jgi:hypothetical protein
MCRPRSEEIARGAISLEEAAGHVYRRILTRCLGMAEDIEVELHEPQQQRVKQIVGIEPYVAPPTMSGRDA